MKSYDVNLFYCRNCIYFYFSIFFLRLPAQITNQRKFFFFHFDYNFFRRYFLLNKQNIKNHFATVNLIVYLMASSNSNPFFNQNVNEKKYKGKRNKYHKIGNL